MIYQLKTPIKFAEEYITEIEFREPKCKDIWHILEEWDKYTQKAYLLDFARKLTRHSKAVFDQLSVLDTYAVIKIAIRFLEPTQETPEISLQS